MENCHMYKMVGHITVDILTTYLYHSSANNATQLMCIYCVEGNLTRWHEWYLSPSDVSPTWEPTAEIRSCICGNYKFQDTCLCPKDLGSCFADTFAIRLWISNYICYIPFMWPCLNWSMQPSNPWWCAEQIIYPWPEYNACMGCRFNCTILLVVKTSFMEWRSAK